MVQIVIFSVIQTRPNRDLVCPKMQIANSSIVAKIFKFLSYATLFVILNRAFAPVGAQPVRDRRAFPILENSLKTAGNVPANPSASLPIDTQSQGK